MLAGSRRVVIALCSLLAVAAFPAGAGAHGRIRPMGVSSVEDPKGDVKNDEGAAATQPEADIVIAGAENRGSDVVFTILVDRPTDPKTTKNWEGGATVAAWGVETSGDDTPDYLVAFGRGDNGELAVQAAKLDDQAGTATPCAGTAGLGPRGEFVATVPVGCLGDPASFRYAAAMAWDTDPSNAEAPAVGDSAPDNEKLAGPVTR
ncbi:MAG TPA: hypothetical protein VG795_10720 [Acidimicrobiia bacterium]|nr:hypothetical protein [Acidimicrobiia bacterium]